MPTTIIMDDHLRLIAHPHPLPEPFDPENDSEHALLLLDLLKHRDWHMWVNFWSGEVTGVKGKGMTCSQPANENWRQAVMWAFIQAGDR